MRTRFAAATFLAIGAASVGAGALDLLGSDVMNLLTQGVLSAGVCPAITPVGDLRYLGAGTGNGETFMANGIQGVAPMSRFLQGAPIPVPPTLKRQACADISAKVAGGQGVNGEHAVGLVVALHGVGLTGNTAQIGTCNDPGNGVAFAAPNALLVSDQPGSAPGLQCPNCTGPGGNEYVPSHITGTPADPPVGPWADYLRVLYFGLHHPATPGGTSPRDCDSDVRRTLVASYRNIFQDSSCTGGAGCAAGIRHLWRREDASDTTDTFLALLGTDFRSFCNVGLTVMASTAAVGASDFVDKDPIRIACSGNGAGTGEQICGSAIPSDSPTGAATGNLGTLGLVQVIFPPNVSDVPVAELYPTATCSTGENELLPATKSTFSGVCPAGNPSFGGRCFTSVIRTVPGGSGAGTFNANCIQVKSTAACPFLTPAGTDCRGATLWLRKPNGDLVRDRSLTAAGRNYTGAAYRIHALRPNQAAMAGASEPCALAEAAEQVGCLVGKASHCSFGYSGRSALIPAGAASALQVNGLPMDKVHIQHLTDKLAPAYPLARKLYLASISGFQGTTVTANQLAMAKCFASDAVMLAGGPSSPTSLIAANGFVELPDPTPGNSRVLCQDFDETQPAGRFGCSAPGLNVNVCQSPAYGALGLPTAQAF